MDRLALLDALGDVIRAQADPLARVSDLPTTGDLVESGLRSINLFSRVGYVRRGRGHARRAGWPTGGPADVARSGGVHAGGHHWLDRIHQEMRAY